jgi:L-amino acid N-acyltransferase YncA
LLARVIEACEGLGLRQMVALIGDSGNAGSIGVHRSCGFELTGTFRGLGFNAGRWVDVVMMQRKLNPSRDTPGIDWGGA